MNVDRSVLIDFLHLFALAGFAIAQPLYDLLGRNPEFFVAHSASPAHIIGIVVLLSGGVALSLVLVELAARLAGEHVRRGVHWALIFGLAVLTVLPMVKRWVSGADLFIWGLALLMGFVFAVLYVRWQGIGLFVTVLSPAVVAFPLWFLLLTPVSRLVAPDVIEAQAGIEIDNPAPVVVVVLDEFNITALLDADGRIDPVRFPNFAALAAQSWWFPNATATYVETTVAVSGILTGRNPRSEVRLNPTATDHPQNLFTMLAKHYRLNVIESLTALCPNHLCMEEDDAVGSFRYQSFFADVAVIYLHIIMPPQSGKELPSLEARWTGFGGAWVDDEEGAEYDVENRLEPHATGSVSRDSYLATFLSQIEEISNPGLHFLHVVLPHTKYEYLVSGHQYVSERQQIPVGWVEGPGWGGRWIGEDPLIVTAYHRYLQQIGYLDRFLGRLRDTLETSRLYDNALIILTADHGISFQHGLSMREVEKGNERDILKVPMFVKLPGQREGRISQRLVSGIDILPTIVDVLGVKAPWMMDGQSMLFVEDPPRTEIEIVGVGRIQAKALEGFPRLEWQVEHFGTHIALDRLVPQGPYPALIGQALADLGVGPSSGMRFYGGDFEYLKQVNPESGFLPALFSAYILEANAQNLPIAITLNGRIWATTTTSEWGGKQNYFSVLLPPAAFKKGENVMRVYLIEKTGEKLLPIDWGDGDQAVRLGHDRSGWMKLVFADGREIPVNLERGVMQGNLDSVRLMGNMLSIAGWGADIAENRPAKEVFIFAGNVLLSRGELGSSRPDIVAAHHQQALLHSGFQVVVPVEVLKSHASEIRVVLISKGERNLGLSFRDEQKAVIRAALENSAFSD